MYSKNKRYPANDALKKGSPSTIESACRKPDICLAYVIKRNKYRALKTEYQKSEVKLEQMEQLKKDNGSKLMLINKLNTTITELKDNTRVGNNPQLIKNLQNGIDNLQKKNHELKEQLEKAKEEHLHFNAIWKTEGITEQDIIDMKRQISNQCDLIKELSKATDVKSQKPENDIIIPKIFKSEEVSKL
jgi:hypothetical protein